MQWIFLIGDDSFTLNCFSEMDFKDSQKIISNDDQVEVIYNDNDYVVFCKEENSDDMVSSFESSEFEKYLQKLPFDDPKWIMVKFNNAKILKKILSENGFPTDVIIDCDGLDLGLEEAVDKSRIIENDLT